MLGMDRFGLDDDVADAAGATVTELFRRGFTERMMLSHDAACYIDWVEPTVSAAALPEWNYRHIEEAVLPALGEQGVTAEQIATMLVDNPRRFFERRRADRTRSTSRRSSADGQRRQALQPSPGLGR